MQSDYPAFKGYSLFRTFTTTHLLNNFSTPSQQLLTTLITYSLNNLALFNTFSSISHTFSELSQHFIDTFKFLSLSPHRNVISFLFQVIYCTHHQRSSSAKGRRPLKVVFRQRSSSIKSHLPSEVVFLFWVLFIFGF